MDRAIRAAIEMKKSILYGILVGCCMKDIDLMKGLN
jgi:hypothetical protein